MKRDEFPMTRNLIFLMSLFISAILISGNPVLADSWGPPVKKKTPQIKTRPPTPPSYKNTLPSKTESVDELTGKLMADPESMDKIVKLQNNPTIQKILQDPEIMEAIRNKDLARIASDPKIKALEKNKDLQELLKQNQ